MQNHPDVSATGRRAGTHCAKPFLKWLGGKSRVLNQIICHMPSGNRLIEPFVGSGAVFLGAPWFNELILGDSNMHLIELYDAVVNRLDELVAMTGPMFSERYRSKEAYLEVRSQFNDEHDPLRRAAAFLYLNRFGFNGLCRYNKSRRFNVPYGHLLTPARLPVERMAAFSERARHAKLVCADFADVMQMARPGDVVYCDPPYLDASGGKKTFVGYGAGGFTVERQRDLAALARTLAERGVSVVVSNHDTEFARKLYAGAEIYAFDVRRSVSASAGSRGLVRELLAVFSGTRPSPGGSHRP
ncbi:DNA adenine methylase [Paraburkholderia caribensis]|uniref:DNA adenine methylase n=1 Tax=Paraburkholderia caribensis TaxID=75105 RepID=UPI0007C64212|nr:DNA adenine methylase [Paraburkholderia caribensis]